MKFGIIDKPKCEFCGAEIVAPLSISIVPTTKWVCLECSGASIEDFVDDDLGNSDLDICDSCLETLDNFGNCVYCDM